MARRSGCVTARRSHPPSRYSYSRELNEWLAKRWTGVAQVFCVERTATVLKFGAVRRQVVYGLSNLSLTQAPASRMLELNRAHWGIENQIH